MHLSGVNCEWQQVLMLEEHFIKADPVTDDYITGAEDGPGEMAAVRARKDLNQVFFAFVITLHFLDKLNLFHATAKLLNQIRVGIYHKTTANIEPTRKHGIYRKDQSPQRKIVAKRRGLSMGDGAKSGLKVATDNIVSQANHCFFGRAICK